MLLKHRQDGWGMENVCVHAAIHSVRALTDGSGETASTPKIVSDVAGRSCCSRPTNVKAACRRPQRES